MSILAYVLVRTRPGTSAQLVGSRLIKGVKMANSVLGRYDAVLVISAKDQDDLYKILYGVIEKHPAVMSTETLVAIPYPQVKEPPPYPPERISEVISFHCPNCHSLNKVGDPLCMMCGFEFK